MTKVATIDTRRVLCLILAAAIVAASLLVALVPGVTKAATQGQVTGQFQLNNGGPTVNSVALYNEFDNATASTMDPTSDYVVRVGVTDNNSLTDIDKIEVTVYYDEDGVFSTDNVPADGHAQNGVVLSWDNGTWAIDDGTSNTWAIVEAGCDDPANLAAQNTYTFKFKFTVGTVAKESDDDTGDDAEWHIYAKAWDNGGLNNGAYQENLEMNWYGEITVALSSNTVLDFGALDLGEADQPSANTVNGTYISNGNYNRNIRADSPWTGTDYSVPMDTAYDGTPDNGEFALDADDDNGITDAVVVQTTYVAMVYDGTITTETGDQPTGMTVWITLSGTGIENDTYSGVIYYQISNR